MSAYADKVIADGAVAYWRLNEASGPTAASLVGSYPGTINGAVTLNTAGPLSDGDKAMTFPGADTAYISVPVGAYNAIGTGPFSVEFWARWAAAPKTREFPLSNQPADSTAGIALEFNRTGSPDVVVFRAGNGSVVCLTTTVQAAMLRDGAWHHVVWTVTRGSPDVGRVSVDGAPIGSMNASTSGGNFTSANPLYIGRLFGAAGFSYAGGLDEVAIYQTALTAQQIADHYAAAALPAPGTAPYAPIVLPSGKPPHGQWLPLTPSDIVDSPFSALWVGGAGTVAAVGLDGRVVTFAGVQAGTRLRIAGRRVNDTATTATNLLALGRI